MPQGSQKRGQQDKQSPQKSGADRRSKRAQEQATCTDFFDYLGLAGDASIQSHAKLLNDERLPIVQRQGIASQIGWLAGNQYLQRVLSYREQPAGNPSYPMPHDKADLLQRQDEDETSSQQDLSIPIELQTTVDIPSLSDEELKNRSELILDTLRQFHQKTPAVQRLEDELARISVEAAERAKRPSDVGKRIVKNFWASAEKAPGGDCYAAALDRAMAAYRDILGEELTEVMPEGKSKSSFKRLWGSLIYSETSWGRRTWLNLPEEYRGKGSAGAMEFAGKGTLVEQDQIWSGALLPGAVIQTWKRLKDFERVKAGKKPILSGHSFIFLRYKRKGNKPEGDIKRMVIADQGGRDEFPESKYKYWVAANVTGNLPQEQGVGDKGLIHSLLSGRNRIKGGESRSTNFNIRSGKKFNLDASKIAAEIKKAAEGFEDKDNIKEAIESRNPDRFNIHFAQLVALYQLGMGIRIDGRFSAGTCKKLVGIGRKNAQTLKKS